MNQDLTQDEPATKLLTSSTTILRIHGRSFYWAGQLLTPQQLEQAAALYTLCRQIDDIADEANGALDRAYADKQLECLTLALAQSQAPVLPLLRGIYVPAQQLLAHEPLAKRALLDLIATMRTDLKKVRMQNDADLLQYCYGAAGTVGVMMACLLDAQPRARALPHAIDLGIAMQMTNIARDVLTDAHLDRVYLPMAKTASGIQPDDLIANRDTARHDAWLAVKALLAKADKYYASASLGMRYLPLRPRLAIAVAARVYREIGQQILHRGETAYWRQRSVVSNSRKALVTVEAMLRLMPPFRPAMSSFRDTHYAPLHEGLRVCLDEAAVTHKSVGR